jgi:hypothetical protein
MLEMSEPKRIDEAQAERQVRADELSELWTDLRTVTLRRDRYCLEDVAFVLSGLAESPPNGSLSAWRLTLGPSALPEPAMLIRRVLNGQDPERDPPLPRRRLRRRPLCLVPD